ncbi:hypothetical protein Tsubulata_036478 [Turnera subulata]|uniref:Uncharacterized protein n=1 Tax=Turnera subulata TaxID=218843 RepID=A0A9Q0FT69_9ROSI|nr:hypothetical protein Tsubulata_036478 [Turnera subulata]
MADHHHDDLDELLDSALDDFQSLNLAPSSIKKGDGNTKDGEKVQEGSLPSLPGGVQGLGMGLPDLKAKKKGKQKMASKDSHVAAEALDKLREQTREAVKGLESVAGGPKREDLETMMQQLLSKEILHEPMKEIGERYPKWLEEHKASLSKEDYNRYFHQYELIKNLNEVYEREPNNFTKIVDLMQKMQECGQPPSDIVQELAPDIDFANLGQL